MKIFTWVLSGFAATATAQWSESLEAQGLLGSHFGVPGIGAQYDYVILGGGTAGLTLARRLAQDSRFTVAVVEAGDFYEFANGNNTAVPGLSAAFLGSNPTLRNPFLDWYQPFERQPQMADRSGVFSSGKVLGGGSARNLMLYTRAPKGALKKWAEIVGDDSYEFDNLLPFYKKSARHTPPGDKRLPNATTAYDETYWSPDGGPVKVGYPNWVNSISTWAEGALEEIGLENLPGFADGNVYGYSYSPMALDAETQTRSSAETSYLREALAETTNLNVYKNTIAKKVVFDGKKAVAATVETGGIQFRINATREVIVSAGTFRSPQLLMVSGIGPRHTLEELDIDVLSDLPGVGQNLWDHISFTPSYVVDILTHSALTNRQFFAEQTQEYLTSRTGMLTNTGGDILGFADFPEGLISESTRADLDEFATDWPDIEYLFRDNYFGSGRDRGEIPTDGRNYASPATSLMAPFSRGNITIVSDDTNEYPVFSPNWLQDPRDQEMAVAAFKLARSLFVNSTVMSNIIVGDEVFPGLNVTSDEDILDWARENGATINHATGTCAMGRSHDPLAVVDSDARVFGVENLRVVDASIFPILPACHPMATVYALAEKIADGILRG